MNTRLFRQVALERLSSAEQLDQMLQVTSPRAWAGLAAIFLLLCTALIWGFKGVIVTTADGEGVIVRTGAGANVSMGEPIPGVQPDLQKLELVAYVSSSEAKEIRSGMEVRVSPSNIRREEYGFIKGEVVYVSDYPATLAALVRNFHNESLAKILSSSNPVREVGIRLKFDPDTPSGFQWSASKGPPITITSGTMCTVQIVTQLDRPVSLVLPYIKRKLAGR